MKRFILILGILSLAVSCGRGGAVLRLDEVPQADAGQVIRVEPPSWWTDMRTSLQLMIQGKEIGSMAVSVVAGAEIRGGNDVAVAQVHPADNPDFLFVDIDIPASAKPGTYWLVFSRDGAAQFKVPYELAARAEGSAQRTSFSPADLIYLVFPDRFANGDPAHDDTPDTIEKVDRDTPLARHGGDIQGIIDRLDYIAGLGATVVWCTPLLLDDQDFESYHGYACCDYYRIDPRFGTNELYRTFVEKAHEKGLKVIMDIVTNHCGTFHWWMKDRPFEDWIHVFPDYTGTNIAFSTNMDPNAARYDLSLQESGWFVPMMPDMNLDNPFVLKYFQQFAVWWAEYAGLDGFRVDTYPYNEKEPMSRWCAAVLEEYPSLNIVGECWTTSPSQLAYWQGGNPNRDGFDSHLPSIMDFPLCEAMTAALCESGDNPGWGRGLERVYNCLSHDFVYHDLSRMMIFFANHDHARMGDVFGHDPRKMKMALTLLATLRGIPQLYNGDEMLFSAKPGAWNDGAKRIDFPGGWEEDATQLFTPEGRQQATGAYADAADLHDFTAKLFNWRKGMRVIHEGKTLHFLTRDNTYAFFRYDAQEGVFVYLNNTGHAVRVPWIHYAELVPASVNGTNVLTDEPVTLAEGLEVPAMSPLIVSFKR